MTEARFSYFCPQCSSAMVTTVLLTEQAVCRNCEWEGPKAELLAMPLGQAVAPEDLIKALFHDVAVSFAKEYAPTFGGLLLSWGFLDQTNLKEELQFYVKNAAGAVVASVLRSREVLEQKRAARAEEHVRGKGSYDA